jgi:hypothetical protein
VLAEGGWRHIGLKMPGDVRIQLDLLDRDTGEAG